MMPTPHGPAANMADTPHHPHLVLDLDAFERNVARLAGSIVREGGKRWRPHVKAIRSPELARRLQAAGAQGVTCATVAEAAAMVQAGITDVLVANQVVERLALRQLAILNREATVHATIDAPEHIRLLATAANAAEVRIPVLIEVDVGLQRAGVLPGEAAVVLARAVVAEPALRFAGLMAWEGHTTRIADPVAKQAAVEEAVGRLTRSAEACRAAGIAVDIVSCGGTGTYCFSHRIAGVTEIQAGGGVFGDLRYRTEFHLPLEPALRLRARVVARPSARRLVSDAGWRWHGVYPLAAQPLGLPAVTRMAHAAEHCTLDFAEDCTHPAVGQSIDFDVGYADATTFLHPALYPQRAGRPEAVLPLLRPGSG